MTHSSFDFFSSSFAFNLSAFSFSSFSFFSRRSRSSFSFFSRFSLCCSSFSLRASSFFFSFAALASSFCCCFSCCRRSLSSCSCKRYKNICIYTGYCSQKQFNQLSWSKWRNMSFVNNLRQNYSQSLRIYPTFNARLLDFLSSSGIFGVVFGFCKHRTKWWSQWFIHTFVKQTLKHNIKTSDIPCLVLYLV